MCCALVSLVVFLFCFVLLPALALHLLDARAQSLLQSQSQPSSSFSPISSCSCSPCGRYKGARLPFWLVATFGWVSDSTLSPTPPPLPPLPMLMQCGNWVIDR